MYTNAIDTTTICHTTIIKFFFYYLQMSMSNIHMQQTQSISVTNQTIHQQGGSLNSPLGNTQPNNQNNVLNNFNPQADFNFEFFDNLTSGDAGTFTDQELLSSFDSDAGFNLDF